MFPVWAVLLVALTDSPALALPKRDNVLARCAQTLSLDCPLEDALTRPTRTVARSVPALPLLLVIRSSLAPSLARMGLHRV